MNDYFQGNISHKIYQPIVDIKYNTKKSKSSRISIFKLLSPKKLNNNNNNPKDIHDANNKINSILSKNLKSIYHETKSENPKEKPIFDNIKSLIKKNSFSNKYIYKQIENFRNNIKNNNKANDNGVKFSPIPRMPKKLFRNSEIILTRNKIKYDGLFSTSIKNNIALKNQSDNLSRNSKNKSSVRFGSPKGSINKDKKNFRNKQRNTFIDGFKFPKRNSNFETDALITNKIQFKKLLKENSLIDKYYSTIITSNNNSDSFHKKKSRLLNRANIRANLNKKRNTLEMDNQKSKFSSKSNPKIKAIRHNIQSHSPKKNINIPTLQQINNALTKSFIESRIEKIRKELDDLDYNEISEIIDKLPKKQNENKKNMQKINLKQKMEIEKSEKNELLSTHLTLKEQIEKQQALEEDKFQKKYRKLYLNKNLYDSLDDEEVVDEEKLYTFHIAPNSLGVYILDFFVLIASFLELFFLPLYIALHISSFNIYYNITSSIIFYIIDFIYIIDLISGFCRSYYNFEEELITKHFDISTYYLTGWFTLDLIEAIPIFTLLDLNKHHFMKKFLSTNNNYNNMFDFGLNNQLFALTVIKLLKIFKTMTCNSLLNRIIKFCDKSRFFYEWKGLFSSAFVIISSLNFCTCFFIFIGNNESQGWIILNNLQDKNFVDIYITGLYYLMTTLTTVGYGDISPLNFFEKAYGIFILIVGICAYSWIVTYISNYIKKYNEKFIDFEEKMKVLREIKLEYPNLGKGLYDRIKRYLNYNKSEYKINLKFILESLPSSLQNNLIIEIYKPIIKNFQFFKSFENSDFFVKIVTSLKPILSMKDDILIQEGDIIEDIIFIKKGVLTLEIIIDLNEPKKSVESHLDMTKMECFKNISNHKFSVIMNLNSLNSNYQTNFGQKILNNKYVQKKEIKIIDLRQNEHFGDILMILNEKSPVTIKVKSKKAELFFLQKTEATEISNRYPNIWKRIVNRSLYNMKQIKKLIRKKVYLFVETHNIEINDELKARYFDKGKSKLDSVTSTIKYKPKTQDNIETILEEDESNIKKSQTPMSDKNLKLNSEFHNQKIKSKKNIKNNNTKKFNNKNQENSKKVSNPSPEDTISEGEINQKYIKNVSFSKDDKPISELENLKKNQSLEIEKKQVNFNKDINGVNDMINIIDKEVKKSNKTGQINNFNINIYTPKVHIPLNQIHIENNNSREYSNEENIDIKNFGYLGKINDEMSHKNDFIMDIKENNILMDNTDENNNIFFSKIKCMEKKDNIITTNSNDSRNKKLNIIKFFKNRKKGKFIIKKEKLEKTDIKTNDKTSLRSISSDKSKLNLKNHKDIQIEKNRKFLDLYSSQSTSFTINSSYDNINQISEYKYNQNPELREKTKKFILEQIDYVKKDNNPINKNIIDNDNLLKINTIDNPRRLSRRKSAMLENYNINIKGEGDLTPNKRGSLKKKINKFDSKINASNSSKKMEGGENTRNYKRFFSLINKNNKINKRNSIKKKPSKYRRSLNENAITFYSKILKIRTMNKNNLNISLSQEKSEKGINNKKLNYERLISKNIEKNQQNLNNPQEYFEGFFNDIIFKNSNNKNNNLFEDSTIKKRKTFQK